MRIYYWPEMDQLVMFLDWKHIYASAGKNGWYRTTFPRDVYVSMVLRGELIYEG